jgi:hypothetical protein
MAYFSVFAVIFSGFGKIGPNLAHPSDFDEITSVN